MPIKLPFAAVYAYLFISMVLSPDDAHIFCRESQIKDEVKGGLEFMSYVYKIFGFTFDLKLSTRPEKYLVDLETWQKAEAALAQALDEFGKPREINEGDGTFYGQKIDITVSDAMRRKFQCATLQLDFQLHIGFNLSYSTEDESKMERPVMIHSYSWFCRKNVCHTSRALQGEMAFLAYSAPGNCLPGF